MKPVIVIPIYKNTLKKSEEASLVQLTKVLYKYPVILIAPFGLDIQKYDEILKNKCNYSIEYFEKENFQSVKSYSRLLLEADFYKRFENYNYMFLYQLDGWVFRDELEYWCNQGFDYIGAPWFVGYDKADENSPMISPSGNGGVSLRNIKSFIRVLEDRKNVFVKSYFDILKERKRIIKAYKIYKSKENRAEYYYQNVNEDGAIVFVFNRADKNFKIAPNDVNYKFSFEVNPRKLYKLNNNKLPFACHAFERYDFEFWKQFISF